MSIERSAAHQRLTTHFETTPAVRPAIDKLLVEALPDTLLLVDTDANVVDYKPGGDPSGGVADRLRAAGNLAEIFPAMADQSWESVVSDVLDGEHCEHIYTELVTGGSIRFFELRMVPYDDFHAMVVVRDNGRQHRFDEVVRVHGQEDELARALQRAIENDELELHYQPKLNLAPKCVYGVEALLRWTHPERGPISPERFIPVAEEAGLINLLGDWVLHSACRQLECWQSTALADLRIAINLSASQFRKASIAGDILRAVTRYRLMPESLEIELTESTLMQDVDEAIRNLQRLKEAGISIAIDDFGTGYSSLSYLTNFPLDSLKIDRSFVSLINAESGNHRSICSAVIALAHSLGLTVIAEGVETEEQLQYLHFLDCDQVQGFHFAKPMSAEDASRFLLEHRAEYPRRRPGAFRR